MDHPEIKDLLPLAALDRLDPEEARALEDHLREGCADCESELREYREAAAAMALALEEAGSEHRVWENLEARLHANAAAAHSLAHAVSRPMRGERPQPQGPVGWWRGISAVAAAAAIALIFYNRSIINKARSDETQHLGQLESLNWQLRNMGSDLESARVEAETLRSVLADRAKLDRVLMAPDLQLTRLAPLAPAPGARAVVAVSHASRAGMIQAFGLPPTPPGKTYELWWITKEKGPVNAGLFYAQPGRTVVAPAGLPPPGQRVMLAAVTLEPAGGSEKPTGAMYLKGAIERE